MHCKAHDRDATHGCSVCAEIARVRDAMAELESGNPAVLKALATVPEENVRAFVGAFVVGYLKYA